MSRRVLVSTRYFDAASERRLVEAGCAVIRTGLPDNVQDDTLPPSGSTRCSTASRAGSSGRRP